MDLYTTERGFVRGDFSDVNGDPCSIQESSVATDYYLWLGQNTGTHANTGECMARMHLSREMVAALLPHLQRFVDTGLLHEDLS